VFQAAREEIEEILDHIRRLRKAVCALESVKASSDDRVHRILQHWPVLLVSAEDADHD
jgi:hypothetical protein